MKRELKSRPDRRGPLHPERTAQVLIGKIKAIPPVAVVLGSGFDELANRVVREAIIPYAELPGFPSTTVDGHQGIVIRTGFNQTGVLLLCGRAHYYEGHSMETITFPIRVLAAAGVKILLLTNAAGGILRTLRPGDFMAIQDHINFMGANPLRGTAEEPGGQFVDLTQTYDTELLNVLANSAREEKIKCRKGVYIAVSGPSYETPAEIRAFRRLGADAVGMSTVPEAIVARRCGLRVAGISFITNQAAGIGSQVISHGEVLREARIHSDNMARLITSFLRQLSSLPSLATAEAVRELAAIKI